MSNPLVVAAPPDTAGFTNLDSDNIAAGAGLFSDAADTLKDASQHNWVGLGIDIAADALDTLGLITDPFGALASAPIGWIIEHFGPLKEILDRVGGDPEAVRAHAQTWANVAAALERSAADYTRSAHALADQFTGTAAAAYQRAATNYTTAVRGAAAHAKDAGTGFQVAGTIVGTARGAIRDMFAQFAADALWRGLIALANSAWTFGASIATWTISTITSAISVAERASARVLRAVRQVNDLVGGARSSSAALRHAEQDLLNGAARRTAAANHYRRSQHDLGRAEQRLDHHADGIAAAQRAQERARQKIDEADTPAKRTDAENELRHAEQREAHHREKYRESEGQRDAANHEARTATREGRDAMKHELSGSAATAEERAGSVKDRAGEVNSTVQNTDEDDESARRRAGGVDDGSLV